jgi:hypothetical protein
MTLADGTATAASWKLGQMSGTNNNTLSVIAAGAGLSGNPATITASADADVPASIAIDTGNNQTAVTGTNVTFAPTVVVSDQFTNLVPGATVTFSASGSGTVGSASAATDTDGVASTTWSVNVGGHALSATGTFQNTLTATVQGTAIGTSFTGFAIYSYVTHVDPIWSTNAPGACTGCHTGAGFSGLTLSGGVAVSYPELVTEDLTCDLTLGALYRRVTTAGGISAADTYSVLMRLADPSLPAEGTCGDGGSHTTKLNATNVEIVKAWIRNGAPNN